MVDVDALNDEELRDELVTRGVNVGPIVATTRSLYVSKLKRLLGAENMSGDHLADENNVTQNGFITDGDTHHAQPEQFVRVRNTNLASSASTVQFLLTLNFLFR
ncbi:unnamed protein product [Anisakis simplex]|uniref:LEM domain-containing protein n=1 Tax=Anisakis simplex TaxID=6269 RepID=A0A0M3JMD4_ANISI|nr:unnamed protein product [Anisakis simplex]